VVRSRDLESGGCKRDAVRGALTNDMVVLFMDALRSGAETCTFRRIDGRMIAAMSRSLKIIVNNGRCLESLCFHVASEFGLN
jgi:hypothetical protein